MQTCMTVENLAAKHSCLKRGLFFLGDSGKVTEFWTSYEAQVSMYIYIVDFFVPNRFLKLHSVVVKGALWSLSAKTWWKTSAASRASYLLRPVICDVSGAEGWVK